MSRLRPLLDAVTGPGRRQLAARAGRALSPRGALALHTVDGTLSFALRAALAMALPAVPLALTGRADQAVYTMLGSFTTTFGRNVPYGRRARLLALVALAMTACVGTGSALGAWARPQDGGAGAALVVAATAGVAGIAKFACDAAGLSGLGAVLLLFSFAVAANGSPAPADVLSHTGLAAAGAAVAWLLSVPGRLLHPDRPQRLALAAALRALADLLEAAAADRGHGPARHRATAAVLQAHRALGLMPSTPGERGSRGGTCVQLADLAWSLLIGSARHPPTGPDDPAALAVRLRAQGRLLASRRAGEPALLPGLSAPAAALHRDVTADTGGTPTRTRPDVGRPAEQRAAELRAAELRAAELRAAELRATELRAAELVTSRAHGRVMILLVPAVRMVLGTGLAGGAALALGLGHGYWAAVSAAAVLHSVNVRTAAQRAVQRTLGTMAGLLLALAVLATHPGPSRSCSCW